MDKNTAGNIVTNANMSSYDIAHSIYLATVEGVSGANQHDGYGFALSAVAELWNIRGTIGNPYNRTKITNRDKGMGITENMILNVVSRYPNGISDTAPLFDELLGIGSSKIPIYNQSNTKSTSAVTKEDEMAMVFVFIVAFIILKFFMGWGWIVSFILSSVIGGIIGALLFDNV